MRRMWCLEHAAPWCGKDDGLWRCTAVDAYLAGDDTYKWASQTPCHFDDQHQAVTL